MKFSSSHTGYKPSSARSSTDYQTCSPDDHTTWRRLPSGYSSHCPFPIVLALLSGYPNCFPSFQYLAGSIDSAMAYKSLRSVAAGTPDLWIQSTQLNTIFLIASAVQLLSGKNSADNHKRPWKDFGRFFNHFQSTIECAGKSRGSWTTPSTQPKKQKERWYCLMLFGHIAKTF